jgi:hypothetical protein
MGKGIPPNSPLFKTLTFFNDSTFVTLNRAIPRLTNNIAIGSFLSLIFLQKNVCQRNLVYCSVRGMVKRRQWTIVTAVDEN